MSSKQLRLLLFNKFLQQALVSKLPKRQYANYALPVDRDKLPCIRRCRVGVVGVGGVGSSLAHLLKTYPAMVTELRLLNRSDPSGLVEELNHLPTSLPVYGYCGVENFCVGLEDLDVVVIAIGKTRQKDVPRETLFQENAQICVQITKACARSCPSAWIAVITSPVDRIVPAIAETMKKYGCYDPRKLFGVCELDLMRARHYFADLICTNPQYTYVPVIGGNEEDTIIPLFSRCRPNIEVVPCEVAKLTEAVRCAETRVWKMRGTCTTFAMATAAMRFVHKLSRAVQHEPNIVVSAYTESCITDACFFSNELLLGPHGIDKNLGFGKISEFEKCQLQRVIPLLQERIKCSIQYAYNL